MQLTKDTPDKSAATIAVAKQRKYPEWALNYPKQAGVNHMLVFLESWRSK